MKALKNVAEPGAEPGVAATEGEAEPLLALLEAWFDDGDSGLPAHLWERALLGPAREFLRRPGKRFRARLVESCWALAGGEEGAMPAALPLVVEILHAGSLIVDDIEDGSRARRGGPALHHLYGLPVALNAGNWMYFWPLLLLDRLDLPAPRVASLQRRARQALARCHQGQALDLALRVVSLEQPEVPHVVTTTTRLKTGALTELAAVLGAEAVGAPAHKVEAMARFGRELGEGLQMLDDLGGLTSAARRHKGYEDLCQARPTWPWAWAASTSSAAAFTELRARAQALYERASRSPVAVPAEASAERGGAEVARAARAPSGYAEDCVEMCEALSQTLRELIGDTGRARAQARLHLSLAVLHDALGPSPALQAVEAEVRRLEESYG